MGLMRSSSDPGQAYRPYLCSLSCPIKASLHVGEPPIGPRRKWGGKREGSWKGEVGLGVGWISGRGEGVVGTGRDLAEDFNLERRGTVIIGYW